MIDQLVQLVRIYLEEEIWHNSKLSENEARKYFETLFKKGRVLCVQRQGRVVGYVEWWNISKEQLQRALYGEFHIGEEDINTGNICLINDVWIDPKWRNTEVAKELKNEIFRRNKNCIFIGEEVKRNRRLRYYGERKADSTNTANANCYSTANC
jgi:hemolysin-activating ACP:hemolysin acyltransferase